MAHAGARVAASVAGARENCEVVITMVADDEALEDIVLGENGILDSMLDGAIHMAMGTHGIEVIEKLTVANPEIEQIEKLKRLK